MIRLCVCLMPLLIVSFNNSMVADDEKMDAAVADMKSYLNQNGFPYDMFKQGQDRVDQIQVNTTWWAFESGMAAAFEVHYPRPTPSSGFFLETKSFSSKDFDFEEAVMRTMWGENHLHCASKPVYNTIYGIPPEIRSEFQLGTRIQYRKLAEHIQSVLKANGHTSDIRIGPGQMCEVRAYVGQPPEGLHAWYREHMRWGLVIRVQETSGEHKTVDAGRSFSSTKSRIVLHGHVLVWSTRDNRSMTIGPIFENSFRKHGATPFDLFGGGMHLATDCTDDHRPSGGIDMTRPGPFQGKSPLLLMTGNSALPGYLSPHQLAIANSLLDDSNLQFTAASSPLPQPLQPQDEGPAPEPPAN